jgi:hypothetical protein
LLKSKASVFSWITAWKQMSAAVSENAALMPGDALLRPAAPPETSRVTLQVSTLLIGSRPSDRDFSGVQYGHRVSYFFS